MILNQTNQKVISKKERVCTSLLSQGIGLMFRRKQNLLMIFPEERKVSLHNCFVFYPIDVLLVDKDFKIVEIKKKFNPFMFWNSTQKGKYLIELAFPSEYALGEILKIR
ncbi:MAG: DUF192 domain-containing protein [Candidatus Woesearchaeota archaeon]|jgi:uncharacterized membrane protein (UPF0127 family)